jgi:hypothetical protein
VLKRGKAIPVTSRGGPESCETSRLPHFLDSRLTDGDEVSLTRRLPFTSQEDSWYSFLLEAESTPGHSAAGRIRSIEKSNLFGNRTRDLQAYSIVPQPTTLPRAPIITVININIEGRGEVRSTHATYSGGIGFESHSRYGLF